MRLWSCVRDVLLGVYYVQEQNSNFLTEFEPLFADVGKFAFAEHLKASAVNMWIGEPGTTSTAHLDHYEVCALCRSIEVTSADSLPEPHGHGLG